MNPLVIAIPIVLGIVYLVTKPASAQSRRTSARNSTRHHVTRRTVQAVHDIISEQSDPALTQTYGFEPDIARSLALPLSKMLAQKGPRHYNRGDVRKFQGLAGLPPDGAYGPNTRAALVYFGVPNPPRAYSGRGEGFYAPPEMTAAPGVSNA